MITRKDLAPLDDVSFELWKKELKHRKAKTLIDLYLFCQDFFGWACYKDYCGFTCDDCKVKEYCICCKITIKEVKRELERRFPKMTMPCDISDEDTYIELISSRIVLFAGYIKDMPDIYKCYEVRYFEYVGDNRFVVTVY